MPVLARAPPPASARIAGRRPGAKASTPTAPVSSYPGVRKSPLEPLVVAPEEAVPPPSLNFARSTDRWDLAMPEWRRYDMEPDSPYVKGHWYDPFNRNRLKGDYPIFGQRWFFNFTGTITGTLTGVGDDGD